MLVNIIDNDDEGKYTQKGREREREQGQITEMLLSLSHNEKKINQYDMKNMNGKLHL